jgi:energy-coupling factor transporter ATP-binding protein EcfA2
MDNKETTSVVDLIPATSHRHIHQEKLIAHLEINNQVYIHGPTGSGKSHAVKLAAGTLKKPFYKKLVGNQTTETSILGYMDATGRYVEGIAYKPFIEGGVLLIDEIDNGNPNTNLVINGLSDGAIAFPIGMREAHKDFILVATANTIGNGATLNYCGRNRLDGALLNRFIFLNWPYDEELESSLVTDLYRQMGGDESNSQITSYINDIHSIRLAIDELAIQHIVSPRTAMQGAKMLASKKFTSTEIFVNCIVKGLDKDTQKKVWEKAKSLFFSPMDEIDNNNVTLLEKLIKNLSTGIKVKQFVDKLDNAKATAIRSLIEQKQAARAKQAPF